MSIRYIILSIVLSLVSLFGNVGIAAIEAKEEFAAQPTVFSATYGAFTLQSFGETDREAVKTYWSGIAHSGVSDKDKLDAALSNQLARLATSNPFAWTVVRLGEEIVGILQIGVQPVKKYESKFEALTNAFTALIGVQYDSVSEGEKGFLTSRAETLATGIGTCSLAIRPEHFAHAVSILEAGFNWFNHFKSHNLPQGNPKPSIVSAIIDPALGEHYKAAGFTVLTDARWHSFYDAERHFAVREIPGASTHVINWDTLGSQL